MPARPTPRSSPDRGSRARRRIRSCWSRTIIRERCRSARASSSATAPAAARAARSRASSPTTWPKAVTGRSGCRGTMRFWRTPAATGTRSAAPPPTSPRTPLGSRPTPSGSTGASSIRRTPPFGSPRAEIAPPDWDQIVTWLGADFDGVIVFDEAHAMANAAGGGKGGRGPKKASLQGMAGLALQNRLPKARILYVSATGATTPENLAYAARLGLWGGPDAPFPTRDAFMDAVETGGVAGDGADRARAEGHGSLHRPLSLVRRRRIRSAASSAHGRRHCHLGRLGRRLPADPITTCARPWMPSASARTASPGPARRHRPSCSRLRKGQAAVLR